MLHKWDKPDAKPNLHGRTVSPETVERFRGFLRDALHHQRTSGEEKDAAYQTLVKKWGNTYFFYCAFDISEPRPGWKLWKRDTPTGAGK